MQNHQAVPAPTSAIATTPITIPAIAPPEIVFFEGVCVAVLELCAGEGVELVIEVAELVIEVTELDVVAAT